MIYQVNPGFFFWGGGAHFYIVKEKKKNAETISSICSVCNLCYIFQEKYMIPGLIVLCRVIAPFLYM